MGNLTLRGYWTKLTSVSDPRALPLFYLLDQRVRPRPMIFSVAAIAHHLGRFLSISDHPGARTLIAEALSLDPSLDAKRLGDLFASSPMFVRFCLAGRLHLAIKAIPPTGWLGCNREQALDLVADLLLYHAALQAQLVAAGIWNIDNLFISVNWRAGRYDENAALNDLDHIATTIKDIADHMLGRRKRHPNSNMVTSLKRQAQEWRNDRGGTDAELRKELKAVFAKIRPVMSQIVPKIRHGKHARTSKKGQPLGTSIHKSYFGSAANEALYFAVTGLCQLREAAGDMVRAIAADDGTRAWEQWEQQTILLTNVRRAKLIYAWRATLIRDPRAPKLNDKTGRPVDLHTAFEAELNDADNPKLPGKNLIDEAHKRMKGPAFIRVPVLRGKLEGVRRFDVIPEYLLQFRMLSPAARAKVATLRRSIELRADPKKFADERNQHIPPQKAPKRALRR